MKVIGSTSAWRGNLEDGLGKLKRLGFDEIDLIGIEAWKLLSPEALVSDFETEKKRVLKCLEASNTRAVTMNVAFTPDLGSREESAGNESRLSQVKATLRFMEDLGISVAAHYPGYISDWRNDPEGVWKDTTDTIREIQEVASGGTGTLAPELHYKTPFEIPKDARRLLADVPGLPYTYEPSHFIVQGIDVEDTEDLLSGATHVHLRGCAKGALQAPPAECEKELRWVVEKLAERDYKGLISIEYLPDAEFDVERAIAETRDLIAGVLA
ncbi:sugar phosphate isomerase/epimerase family protein [Pelagicoccus mobilis]|uniref:Sugar phosphate isomerase/epimerase n=1 Tax=Pelagicoccus mobilis TaxID=415221 RepID=A0A934S7T9_9BACT|nr:sugar phosphate isomerase/epimerase [Pelagicoccus mobilis]MBK1880473.1 sugar phosphate isomerase/epimerase [Pelagicoccus mobilis]